MSARVNVSKTILDSGTFPHAAILSLWHSEIGNDGVQRCIPSSKSELLNNFLLLHYSPAPLHPPGS